MPTIGETTRPGFVYDSATDTWIPVGVGPHAHTPAAIGAIASSIVTTKGDLIVATGSGTVVRQGVGADGSVLVANSAQADGVEWSGAWTSYSSNPVNITVGNGTLISRYQQTGKTVNLEILFTLGSTSAVTSTPQFALPVTAKIGTYSNMGSVAFGDYGVANYVGLANTPFGNYIYLAMVNTTATFASENAAINATTPFTWTTNDYITIRATYEAA